MRLQLATAAFADGGEIPVGYICDGEGLSPPFFWTGAPPETRSFAFIADDPDAPGGVFTHWLLYNLLVSLQHLPEGIPPVEEPDAGGTQGTNDFGSLGYGPPCPPPGYAPHRYHWTLYALDAPLALHPGVSRQQVFAAMQGRILDASRIYGSYRRRL